MDSVGGIFDSIIAAAIIAVSHKWINYRGRLCSVCDELKMATMSSIYRYPVTCDPLGRSVQSFSPSNITLMLSPGSKVVNYGMIWLYRVVDVGERLGA